MMNDYPVEKKQLYVRGFWAARSCWGVLLLAWLLCFTSNANANFERDADGWTILTPSASSRTIYVSSSSGSNANDGLTPATAVRSISRGVSMTRDNSNDFLLFKKGDTWDRGFGDFNRGGLSADQPLVVSSYGTGDRPLFNTGSRSAVTMWDSGYANSHDGYNNIVFRGLHFNANTYDGVSGAEGIRVDRPGQNLLFEDMYIEGYGSNLTVQSVGSAPMGRNIQIRRSVITNSFNLRQAATWSNPSGGTDEGYAGGFRSQGIYASGLDGLLIEENVFDHNGWKEGVPGAERTSYNHNMYLQDTNTDDVIVRGNIIANGSATGVQVRPGGILENNLFIGNSIGAFIGGAGGRAEGNVFLHSSNDALWTPEGRSGGPGPRNWGLSMENISGSEAFNNLILHTPEGRAPLTGLAGVASEGNLIYHWGSSTLGYDANVYTLPFPDPERTVASYDASIGGVGSIGSFLAAARGLSRDNWDLNYTAEIANDYFFAGFLSVPEPSTACLGLFGILTFSLARGKSRKW